MSPGYEELIVNVRRGPDTEVPYIGANESLTGGGAFLISDPMFPYRLVQSFPKRE